MRELANKLRTLNMRATEDSTLSAAIFGSVDTLSRFLDLNRARLRIGMWPWRSQTHPEVAMGLAAVCSRLLENWQDVQVYRLFAALEGAPEQYQWSLEKSQFTVDDWLIEPLGENVAIWGALDKTTEGWSLKLEIENDLLEDEEAKEFKYQATNVAGLISQMPNVASDIATFLEAEEIRRFAYSYEGQQTEDASLETALKQLFDWERNLLLALWGKPWQERDVLTTYEGLLASAQGIGGEFGAWASAAAVTRAMLPGFQPIGELLVPIVPDLVNAFPDYPKAAVVLAYALYNAAYPQEAFSLLNSSLERHSDDPNTYLALAELYLSRRMLPDTLGTFQLAIEQGATDIPLYIRYAEVLLMLDLEGYRLDEFVLMTPDDYEPEEMLLAEAIEAYEEVLELDPNHQEALYQQLLQIADIEDERLWIKFAQLVKLDQAGDKVRGIIEALFNYENFAEGIRILREAITQEPNRTNLYINLAAMYLMAERGEQATTELDKARALTEDSSLIADIERLKLSAENPDFEQRLGEISDVANAGNELSAEDVEFLEETVAHAPRMPELYLLLSKAYLAWEEPATALETLLDGQKHLPDDSDILEMLGTVLWDADERKAALDYLHKGLENNPNHVPLLARMGRCLFDNDEFEQSKSYLLKAEMLAPRHPALNDARVYIARMLEESDSES